MQMTTIRSVKAKGALNKKKCQFYSFENKFTHLWDVRETKGIWILFEVAGIKFYI